MFLLGIGFLIEPHAPALPWSSTVIIVFPTYQRFFIPYFTARITRSLEKDCTLELGRKICVVDRVPEIGDLISFWIL